jgi:hypothetical protein
MSKVLLPRRGLSRHPVADRLADERTRQRREHRDAALGGLGLVRADASGKSEGAKVFLGKLKDGGDREIIGDIDVRLFGRHRAVVTCVVKTGGKEYHNVRLFVRDKAEGQEWKLLGWANEAV